MVSGSEPAADKKLAGKSHTQKSANSAGIGIIGYGARGKVLLQTLSDLPEIEIRAVCDVQTARLEKGAIAAGKQAQAHRYYLDLLDRDDIDAVVIATPDHWHSRMAIEAAKRGKHIYLEKCMTRTEGEAVALREAVRQSAVVFQLGHQGRQRDLNHKARELIRNETIGQISLIETTTNRNDSPGGWQKHGTEQASPDSIDWDLFLGPDAEKVRFSPERYHGWRSYWDYGTGMSGDLLSNEFDVVNSILDLGIPVSAMASGGVYYHQDGREVPDVFQASFEYPDRKLSLIYSGTLSNGIPRGILFMGKEATLELGRSLTVWADAHSMKYKSRIESAMISPSTPFIRYDKEHVDVDAVSSPTSKYYADRGLVDTYREGKPANTTSLHLAEWIHCIRTRDLPSCHMDRGFEEAITSHMATRSYQEGRRVFWDAEKERIV